jgi:hypothetical protein
MRPASRSPPGWHWSFGAQLVMARHLVEGVGGVVVGAACVKVDDAARAHVGLEGIVLRAVLRYRQPG